MTRRSLRVAAVAVAGFVAVAILMRLGMTAGWDTLALQDVAVLRSSGMTRLMLGVTTVGGGDVLAPVALLIGAWLWRRRDWRHAGHYLGAVLLGWGCYGFLKWAFARPRPSVIERLDGAGWWSFPSGHAMASVIILGLAVVLVTERRIWWGAVGLLVALIAFSRVYLGVHYPTDVVAGLFGGVAWVALAVALFRPDNAPAIPAPAADTLPAGRTSEPGAGR